MSWEHAIARELKKRDNPVYYAWFSGEVTSPVQTTDCLLYTSGQGVGLI